MVYDKKNMIEKGESTATLLRTRQGKLRRAEGLGRDIEYKIRDISAIEIS